MAYFGPEEKLYYAVSDDARIWTALNGGRPVLDAGVRLRDPFLNRVGNRFHLVHTKGWDHPTIFHWESSDLIHWKGNPIDVVDESRKRAWAPEFFFEPQQGLFYRLLGIDRRRSQYDACRHDARLDGHHARSFASVLRYWHPRH